MPIIPHLKLIAAGLTLVTLIGLGWWLRHSGYQSGEAAAEARMQAQVERANIETARIEQTSRFKSQESAREIETLRAEHDAEMARARSAIRPVRLCPSADRSELPRATDTTSAVNPPDASAELSVHAGADIGTALLVFAGHCQRDNDTAISWQRWWAQQDAIR